MGNSLGNFSDYWDMFWKYDRLAGGYIWDFADQSIRTKVDGKDKWNYGGDFGDKPKKSNAFNTNCSIATICPLFAYAVFSFVSILISHTISLSLGNIISMQEKLFVQKELCLIMQMVWLLQI